MNCQKGDLARIISVRATQMQRVADRVVRVTRYDVDPDGERMWHYEPPLLVCGCGCGGELGRVADTVLRPIGNPGADAVDETLAWLPVPNTDEVPA